ncbi:MAG TPA: inositol monophosphatase [Planctomycetota bacterium]|nr:inositol monophosphatase [Planctomycetota bacterium]
MPALPLTELPQQLLARAHAVACAAATEVAILVNRCRRTLRPTQIRRKGIGDFVTTVDTRSERRLRTLLGAGLRNAGFLGEETPGVGLDRELVWVVDPIDGTSNFARGLPYYAVSIALLHRRQPVVAALWCEPEGSLYSAALGQGARRDGRRVMIPRGRCDDGAVIGCQWHRGQQDLRFLARLQTDGSRIRSMGCTVVQLVDVVMGRLDANVQQQGRIWDVAAAGLVLTEAGGVFTDWSGRPVFPFPSLQLEHTPTIAASRQVHARLLELVGASARAGTGRRSCSPLGTPRATVGQIRPARAGVRQHDPGAHRETRARRARKSGPR